MQFLNRSINPLGMGCWPIGGAMFSGDQSLGYTNQDDAESIRTIHAALDSGITLFDTAAAYGAGHSERLLGLALKKHPDAIIVTKIGMAIDEVSKQINFDMPGPRQVLPAIEACLERLNRDKIDLLLLHQNAMPIGEAMGVFDEMQRAVDAGKIGAFGWSTDYSDRTFALAERQSFVAVEHAMNVFFDAPQLQQTISTLGLTALIRSPLAMGLLTGKYNKDNGVPSDDVRHANAGWMEYFKDGKPNPVHLAKLEGIRDLLTTNGRNLVQGALAWLWAKGDHNVPIPGARTVEQITDIGYALRFGPLPQAVMEEIETLIPRDAADLEERPR